MPKVLSWPGGTLSYNINVGSVGPFWIAGTLSSSLNIESPSISTINLYAISSASSTGANLSAIADVVISALSNSVAQSYNVSARELITKAYSSSASNGVLGAIGEYQLHAYSSAINAGKACGIREHSVIAYVSSTTKADNVGVKELVIKACSSSISNGIYYAIGIKNTNAHAILQSRGEIFPNDEYEFVGHIESDVRADSIAIFDCERNVLISCSSLATAIAIRRILGLPLIIVVNKVSNIGPSVGSIKAVTQEVANELLCSGPRGNTIESKGATTGTPREVGPRGKQS